MVFHFAPKILNSLLSSPIAPSSSDLGAPIISSIFSQSSTSILSRFTRLERHSMPCGIFLSGARERSNLFSALSFFNEGTLLNLRQSVSNNEVRPSKSETESGKHSIFVPDRSRTLSPCSCLKNESAINPNSSLSRRNRVDRFGHLGECPE
uniref:Uncharacterized protein n=1 Tax=Salix viminalis TaxID=40686 RepID=A0A6N2KV45_SALVM